MAKRIKPAERPEAMEPERQADLLAQAEAAVEPFHAEPAPVPAPAPPAQSTVVECLAANHATPWGIVGLGWRVRFVGGRVSFINNRGERAVKTSKPVPEGAAGSLLATGKFKKVEA